MSNVHTYKTYTYKKIIVLLGLIFTIVSMALRLFLGWDQDESLIIILAERVSNGKVLFKDLWDLAQTCGVFSAVFAKAFFLIKGSYEGFALYMRVVSLVVQIVVAVVTYVIFRKHVGKFPAFMAFVVVANILPRATQQLEYGATSIWAALLCSLVLYDICKTDENSWGKTIIAAIFYAVSVFSYPTMLLSVPFIVYVTLLRMPKPRLRYFLAFCLTCMALAMAFFVYLFSAVSPADFLRILGELGKNGDHSSFFRAFTTDYYIIRTGTRLLGSLLLAIVMSLLCKRILKLTIEPFYFYVLLMTLIVVLLNISGLRPSGPFGFLERYIGATVLAWSIIRKSKDKELVLLFYYAGIVNFLGALMGSNLGFNENAMFLELSIIAFVVASTQYFDGTKGMIGMFCKCSLCIFLMGIILFSGYFVRVDGTGPANVFQCTHYMNDGVLKGIWIDEDKYIKIKERCEIIRDTTDENKEYLIVTNDPIYYFYVNGSYNSVMYTTTAQHNIQWVDYFTEFDHVYPDAIYVDTYLYPQLNDFYKSEFGEWVNENYSYEGAGYEKCFYKMVLNIEQ